MSAHPPSIRNETLAQALAGSAPVGVLAALVAEPTYGTLKKISPALRSLEVGRARAAATHTPRADEAMRAASAFSGVADALDTQLHYAPKFCISGARSQAERELLLTAGFAFNLAAERAGQVRRCLFF